MAGNCVLISGSEKVLHVRIVFNHFDELVGAVIIFATSWLATSVVFPNYFAEMAEGYRAAYENMGLSAEEVADLVTATAATSPVKSAFDGVVGTIGTSVVAAAIAGFWLRRKGGGA